MKNIGVVTALLLAATLSSGAIAAENSFASGGRFKYRHVRASESY